MNNSQCICMASESRSAGSVADWLTSLESTLLELQNEKFVDLFDSESLTRLDKALSTALPSIRIRRNARRPVNRLPLEIFSRIFRYAQQDGIAQFPDAVFTGRPGKRHPPPVHLSLMLVCRYWRDVMLAFHSLWSTVVITNKWPREWPSRLVAYVKRTLKRSGSGPVDLYSNLYDQATLEVLATRSSCLRTLHLKSDYDFCWSEFEPIGPGMKMFSRPAPLLECIYFHQDYSDNALSRAVLPRLFDNQTPRLRQLLLRGDFSWQNTFTTLTHLTLHGPEMRSSQAELDPFLDLLALLRGNPGLQEFNLVRGERWLHPDLSEIGDQTPIELSHLERLLVKECTPSQVSLLLALLKLPPGASMRLQVDSTVPRDDMYDVLPRDTSNLKNIPQITALTIYEHPYVRVAKTIGTGASSGLYLWHTIPFSGNLEQDIVEFNESSIRALARLPLAVQLQELWLTRELPDDSDEDVVEDVNMSSYRDLFIHTTALRKLSVSGGRSTNVLTALLPNVISGTLVIPSPRLEVVLLEEGADLPRELLLSFAQRRAEVGCPIRKLSFYLDSGLEHPDSGQYVENLRRHVQDVDPGLAYMPEMDIPERWGAKRHDYWSKWDVGTCWDD